jgi:hypothetical protein
LVTVVIAVGVGYANVRHDNPILCRVFAYEDLFLEVEYALDADLGQVPDCFPIFERFGLPNAVCKNVSDLCYLHEVALCGLVPILFRVLLFASFVS